MADIRVCRLCKTKINKQVAVALFSSRGGLLESVSSWMFQSPHQMTCSQLTCGKCRTRIVSLEKAFSDLAMFRQLARSSLEGRGVKKR